MKSSSSQPADAAHTSPVSELLKRHKVTHNLKGSRDTSYQTLASELMDELEIEKHRTNGIAHSLNAILNQYQVTASQLKAQQAAHEELARKYNQKLLELQRLERQLGTGNGDDTETEGA